MEPIVFVNIGWMKDYKGPTRSDKLNPGNFGYFKKMKKAGRPGIGHEQWNFQKRSGRMFGYVPRSARINISRLGAASADEKIDGVLVVFIARDPLANVLKVVGWYQHATVSREIHFARKYGKTRVEASIAARAKDCHVLSVSDRSGPIIPTARSVQGGMGQSPIWYAEEHPDIVQAVRKLVAKKHATPPNAVKPSKKPPTGAPRNFDIEKRLAVERKAMEWAMRYFNGTDVSMKKSGWDIEAKSDDGKALIEVKGLSGSYVSVELTPREYEQMKKHKGSYLLFVLSSALSKRPVARVFRYRDTPAGKKASGWISDRGEILEIEDRVGARCTI